LKQQLFSWTAVAETWDKIRKTIHPKFKTKTNTSSNNFQVEQKLISWTSSIDSTYGWNSWIGGGVLVVVFLAVWMIYYISGPI
jgi:hypothetical protein